MSGPARLSADRADAPPAGAATPGAAVPSATLAADPAPGGARALTLFGRTLHARPSGALWQPDARRLTVADLHLGRSERLARRGGALLPPYETAETLERLAAEIAALDPAEVVCLGDSVDDLAAGAALPAAAREALAALAAGRAWTWIAGNHDPAPLDLPGTCRAEIRDGPLLLRHAAEPDVPPGVAEVTGHLHPKARPVVAGRRLARRCFVLAPGPAARLILPAFGAYTGGLDVRDPALRRFAPDGLALLLGRRVTPLPLSAL